MPAIKLSTKAVNQINHSGQSQRYDNQLSQSKSKQTLVADVSNWEACMREILVVLVLLLTG